VGLPSAAAIMATGIIMDETAAFKKFLLVSIRSPKEHFCCDEALSD